MPNPNSGILDFRQRTPTLVPTCLAGWSQTARPASPLRNALRKLVTGFLAWRARHETLRLLSSLDAATLCDLGLTDIESVVYGDPQDRVRGYRPNWWRGRK
jgi:uncharacterized protein YjiS (DUF1127 family)